MKIPIWVRLLLALLSFSFNLFAPIAVLAQNQPNYQQNGQSGLNDSERFKLFDEHIQKALKEGTVSVSLTVRTNFTDPKRPLTKEEEQARNQANTEAKERMLKKLAPYKPIPSFDNSATFFWDDSLDLELNAQSLQMLKYDPDAISISGDEIVMLDIPENIPARTPKKAIP
jgi:hypothetical protein